MAASKQTKETIEPLLTATEIVERYGISKATLYNWMDEGRFPKGLRLGRIRRWTLGELEGFEAKHRVA